VERLPTLGRQDEARTKSELRNEKEKKKKIPSMKRFVFYHILADFFGRFVPVKIVTSQVDQTLHRVIRRVID
jgi:hypothetical protein